MKGVLEMNCIRKLRIFLHRSMLEVKAEVRFKHATVPVEPYQQLVYSVLAFSQCH